MFQDCKLPHFSLKFQTFCYTAGFPTTFFYICQKTFSHSITKQPASTLEFQYFYSILQMNFCGPRQKREERPFSTGTSCAWAGLWPVVAFTLRTWRCFQTFLRHNVGNPEPGILFGEINTKNLAAWYHLVWALRLWGLRLLLFRWISVKVKKKRDKCQVSGEWRSQA